MPPRLPPAVLLSLASLLLAGQDAGGQLRAPPPHDTTVAAPDTLPRREVRVCAGGDVTLGTNLDTTWAIRASRQTRRRVRALPDPDSLLAALRPLVRDADIVLVNVEGAIGTGPAEQKCGPRSTACYAFRQPIAAAAALRRLSSGGAVVGNVANNHAGDAGWAGRLATIRHLDSAGVHVTGADTIATPVATAAGDTVGFLGFATSSVGPDVRDLDAVRRHVARAAERWPRVVVTMHMGAEGRTAQRTLDTTEIFYGTDRGNPVAFARTAVESGADLVVGHGPHVMRAIEWRGDALVFYSLGNLLTYGPFSFAEPMNRGAIACVALDSEGRVLDAALRSTRQRPPGFVSPDTSARAAQLTDSLTRLDFPESAAGSVLEARLLRPAEP